MLGAWLRMRLASLLLRHVWMQAGGTKRKRETDEAGESAALVREFLQVKSPPQCLQVTYIKSQLVCCHQG